MKGSKVGVGCNSSRPVTTMKRFKPSLLGVLCCILLLSSRIGDQILAAPDEIVCPREKSTDKSLQLEIIDPNGPPFHEISGLGFSLRYKGPSGKPLLYAVNDGGGRRRMGIFDSGTGKRLKTLRLPRTVGVNLDYEAMSVGSCGIENGTCIYIGDIGDNTARNTGGNRTRNARFNRHAYPIYKIQEPHPSTFKDNDILPASSVTTLRFNYFHPSSPTRYSDCEAMFLDHKGWGQGKLDVLVLLDVDFTFCPHISLVVAVALTSRRRNR